MDKLESKILEILNRGTPIRAVKIAEMLGVERREVNHYLYSSLKHLVVQDSDFKWSLKTNQIRNPQPPVPTQPRTPQTQASQPVSTPSQKSQTPASQPVTQNNSYSFTKKNIQQDPPIRPSSIPTPTSQPVKQSNPYEVVKRELNQVSSEEKIKIIENAFRQDRFAELEDEQINALQSILEQSKHEVRIANTAYTQGKLSFWQNNRLAIAVISLALSVGTMLIISQLISSRTYQPIPSIPQSR
ncbi:MAG: hypothetical protein EA343_24510 [Nodularia sp. (in: Bacteria)]|nr:MAG: hypothetical protein EA343_24510 [Nodularia sp. (in: cyanobacteria)]